MKQKTIATRHLRTKIAAGYVLILFVIFGIVYIWLNEQHRRQELEITSQKIRCLRKDIHEVYVKMVDLSLIGETVLDWNEEDMNNGFVIAIHAVRLLIWHPINYEFPLSSIVSICILQCWSSRKMDSQIVTRKVLFTHNERRAKVSKHNLVYEARRCIPGNTGYKQNLSLLFRILLPAIHWL